MSPTIHRIYIFIMSAIVVVATIYLGIKGYSYYSTPVEMRFDHPDHAQFKPSGIFGHGLGIVGTLLILVGVVLYIARKRYGFLERFGRLKYWLEFHIFLCSLGPVLVLYHTAFKFGGIVSVAFWSMVAVVLSGVLGRFIYVQIPRSIEGRALSLGEVKSLKTDLSEALQNQYKLTEKPLRAVLDATLPHTDAAPGGFATRMVKKHFQDLKTVSNVRKTLLESAVPPADARQIAQLIRNELSLNNRIERLQTMQNLFRYWHVAHLPFALIMLIIVVVHVVITLMFGYKWVF